MTHSSLTIAIRTEQPDNGLVGILYTLKKKTEKSKVDSRPPAERLTE
jgi:hypothetical protein